MSTYQRRKDAVTKTGLSYTKLLSTSALTAAGLVALSGAALANNPWDLNQVGGSFDTDTSQIDTTTITQNSSRAIGEGNLDIESFQTVNIIQNSSDALFVARDNRADPTRILGALNANGRVLVIDGDGVFFGKNSVVNVGGIIASTGDVSNVDIMSGSDSLEFGDFGDGAIELNGTVNVSDAGLAAFVSPMVKNNGVINAKMGTVAFAAGEAVTLDLYGDGLVEIEVAGELEDALLENTGKVHAEGGRVHLTAAAAKDAVDNIINVEGLVTVASAEVKGGKIILSGGSKGKVNVAGTLDASGTEGGDVKVTGEYLVADAGAVIDASGVNGGGDIHFGGEVQGGGDLPTADYAFVDQNAILRSNALEEGDGGEIVVWSDEGTAVYGGLEAKGGAVSGDGGFVEVSSLEFYDFDGHVDTTAANGSLGTFLLDPRDIEIRGGTGDSLDNGGIGGAGNGNLGDGSTGLIEAANNFGLGRGTFVLFESEIEGQSATTNIDIQARRNITTVNGGDGVVTLADGSNLSISTTNTPINPPGPNNAEFNNNGIIDLTNLEFETAGSGSITVTGSTGSGVSNITVGELRSEDGDITLDTDNGFISLRDDLDIIGSGSVVVNAEDDITTSAGASISTNGGSVEFSAGAGTGDDIFVDADISTNGGDATFVAGGTFEVDDNNDVINTAGFAGSDDGDITVTSRSFTLDGQLNAGDGQITLGRVSNGQIDVGDSNGSFFRIDQGELGRMSAGTLQIGQQGTDVDNNVRVDNADASAFAHTILSTKTPSAGVDENVTFEGTNTFDQLTVNADDNVAFADNSSVTTQGSATFNTNTNNGAFGSFLMGANSSLISGGNDITVNTLNALIGTGAQVDAEGGNVDFNNSGVFASSDAGSVRTSGVGTIEFNQNGGSAAGGSIQNAIDAIENTGTGQNTLFTDGATYNENLTINENNLKIDGAGTLIIGDGVNTVISVEASNFSLDPVIVDANGADYGIEADDVGADGLDIDGNTFRNAIEAGIFLEGVGSITSTIRNNIFEGSATRGVELGGLGGGITVNITNNTIGSTAGLSNGLLFDVVNDATINIEGGSITTSVGNGTQPGDGIHFKNGLNSGAEVNVTNVDINASDEAIDFQQSVRSGATVNISGGSNIGAGSGIEFSGIAGEVNIANTTIEGNSSNRGQGINLLSDIAGALNVLGNSITGGVSGIGTDGNAVAINGGSLNVRNNTITGTNGDGVELGALTDSNVQLVRNSITGGADGIGFDGDISNSEILVSNVSVDSPSPTSLLIAVGSTAATTTTGADNGIVFGGEIANGSLIQISGNGSIEGQNGDGVQFAQGVTASIVNIGGNDEINGANGTGVNFAGAVNDADVTIGAHQLVLNGLPNIFSGIAVNFGGNELVQGSADGIGFEAAINNSTVAVSGNAQIIGGDDGVSLQGEIVNGSTVTISDNTAITGSTDDGVDIVETITGTSTVNITGNGDIAGGDNSLEFAGVNGASVVNVIGNNAGITAADHGIIFEDAITDGSDININDNIIVANIDNGAVGSGILFEGDISDADIEIGDGALGGNPNINASNIISVGGNGGANDGIRFNGDIGTDAQIEIDGNRVGFTAPGLTGPVAVEAIGDDGIQFSGQINDNANIEITDNRIETSGDGIVFFDTISDTSTVTIGETVGDADGNVINAGVNGINFEDAVTGQSTVDINSNAITGQTQQGIVFRDGIDGATVGINNNDSIVGQVDGVRVLGEVENGAIVNIDGNTLIEGINNEAIHLFGDVTGNSSITVLDNGALTGADNGLEFAGDVFASSIEIARNVVQANNNAILFGDNLGFSANIDINDNIIAGDADNNGSGDGVRFNGDIFTANINIGDGGGESFFIDPSNVISGVDGIHFDGIVTNGADIDIRGNRIGYGFTTATNNPVGDDAIQFIGDVSGDADIDIASNFIRSNDDGISFIGEVRGGANVSIGEDGGGNIIDAGNNGDGIQFADNIEGTALVDISFNDVQAGNNGIVFNGDTNSVGVTNPDEILIASNAIDGGLNGILFEGRASNGLHDIVIRDNTSINGRNGDGVRHEGGVNGSELFIQDNDQISGNVDGIHVEGFLFNSARVDITGNEDVSGVLGDGIEVTDTGLTGGSDVNILDNLILSAGNNGIEAANVSGVEIRDNTVFFADNDGISVENSEFVDVNGNLIAFSGDDGIDVEDSVLAEINNNTVLFANDDGIEIRNSFASDINDNLIAFVGDDGIFAFDSRNLTIGDNTVVFAVDDGIDVRDSNDVIIAGNDIDLVGEDGIFVSGSSVFAVENNTVNFAGEDGIDVQGGDDGVIRGNTVEDVANSGIELENASNSIIDANTVNRAGGAGIFVDPSDLITVSNNSLDGNDIGIQFLDVTDSSIEGNTITNSLTTGIELENVDGIEILTNMISDSGSFGLEALGGVNGDVTLVGNTFTDNPTGARFESGNIDLSDLTDPNSFINNDPLATPVGLAFDETGAPGSLTIEGNTLGATVFDGFTNVGSFYVRVEDGVLLDTATNAPITIDGLNADFDGLVPASQGDILSAADLAFLEARLFDADDAPVNGRGQIFVGAVAAGIDNVEDFFNQFGAFEGSITGLNVTLTGLPSVISSATGLTDAAAFANIAPAAGGGDDGAVLSAEDVANIEPGSGDIEGACWGDTAAAAGGGQSVNLNWGGTFEDSLAAAVACASGTF